ncbi:phosphoglycerate mutase (2,3-diphosphoglycerate-independent) [candidate division LCP-89 bacterium B3_LCP]|uniref:2,3-bisphosphoglycerate-independent phosphoglycerate mutase n=1 Tax=candidate division LCP-89 bacterium B3_LCP TaxID=2012998 RepID=A0A532UVY2_UNCL8|nr:MAG: phosphoglycerate mutase (2,3-diphosphoglycerate-independent) [candidate division LCP-89 bacterium B3_LCP]
MLRRDKVILVIMDGLGLSPSENSDGNAFKLADTPHLDKIFAAYPLCKVEASGRAVGLPAGQMGNSEVGHQNIGAGRVVYQDITRIDLAVERGEFDTNSALHEAFDYAAQRDVTLHLIGLVSDGGVHSSLNHLEAIISAANSKGVKRLTIHALMDGRDTPPHSGIDHIRRVASYCEKVGTGSIGSVMGRYYAMDRDNRWERVERAYNALVKGKGHIFDDPVTAMQASYDKDITDEFVEPSIIQNNGEMSPRICDKDAVIFFNFRADRAREISRALTEPGFREFPVEPMNLHYTTMTRYHQDFPFPVLFLPQTLSNILGEIVSDVGLKQLRIAETEKYAHVTFFFNGGEERVFDGEDRILIPSPRVATYDLQPEMSQPEVTDRAVEAIAGEKYNLIVLNYANPDMVGHTGIVPAAIKAVEAVDNGVWQVMRAAFAHHYAMILTADHGNCEQMIDPADGGPHTAHTTNPVPCLIMDKRANVCLRPEAALCDIAPTILDILGMAQPPEMEGQSILDSGG